MQSTNNLMPCCYRQIAYLKAPPSNLRALVKTTVLAGMLSPVEKVSVANSTCTHSSAKWSHLQPCFSDAENQSAILPVIQHVIQHVRHDKPHEQGLWGNQHMTQPRLIGSTVQPCCRSVSDHTCRTLCMTDYLMHNL